MTLKALFIIALAALMPAQAFALSCMEPRIQQSFAAATDRPELFIIAHGALKRLGPNEPEAVQKPDGQALMVQEGTPYQFKARFKGRIAGSGGYSAPKTLNVTVDVRCMGPWCGGESLSKDGLYFLRQAGKGQYVLEASACSFYFFNKPSQANLRTVTACFKGGCR